MGSSGACGRGGVLCHHLGVRLFGPALDGETGCGGGLRYDRSDECYILYDKREKILAKFSTRDDFGTQFLNFLTDHEIRLCK